MAFLRRPLTQDEAPMVGDQDYWNDPNYFSMPDDPTNVQYGFPEAPPPPVQTNPNQQMPTVTDQPRTGSVAGMDTSGWDVDSYGIPQYTAQNFGSAPSGWDPAKWGDPTHQTPKYVWGRIYQEAQASGDPNWQQQAVERFMQAYPGTQYGGKDVVWTPWGEEVDLFRDYGGENGVSWGVAGAPSGDGGFDLNALIAQMGNRTNLSQSSDPSQWSAQDAASGAIECDPGSGMSAQDCADFYNRYRPKVATGGSGAASGGSTTTTGPQAPQGGMQALYDQIGKLLDLGGEYNEGILNRRVESARESMNRARSSQTDLLRSQLSERGLLGQGPEVTALTGLEEQLGDIYGGQVRDIYADESARSDNRLLETMAIAAGLSGEDASRLVDWFNAQTGRDVGMGQIAATNRRTDADAAAEAGRLGLGYGQLDLDRMLGSGRLGLENLDVVNRYNLGLGDLGLRRDLGMYGAQNDQMSQMLEIIRLMNPAAYQQITNQQR